MRASCWMVIAHSGILKTPMFIGLHTSEEVAKEIVRRLNAQGGAFHTVKEIRT
mgnify:CR=1 FL=1